MLANSRVMGSFAKAKAPLQIKSFKLPNNFTAPKQLSSPHFHPSSSLLFTPSANHSSFTNFKNETTTMKRSFLKANNQLALSPITSFYPTLFPSSSSSSSLTLYKTQRREAANIPSRNMEYDLNRDYSNLLYLIAAVAAFAIGSLIVYAFQTSPTTETTQRLRQSLMYLTGGLGLTALSAKAFFNSPVYYRLATMNPWAAFALTLGGTIASMVATTAIPYENTLAKHAAFASFNAMVGLTLCPLVAVGGPILLKAAFATGAVVSTLGLTAAASPEGTFLEWGGPLSVGLGVVFASSVGSLIFPGSSLLYNVCLYGGAGVFGLFVLHDVDKMKVNAKYSRHYDPINNSISLYMDVINLFVRIVQMYSNSKNRK